MFIFWSIIMHRLAYFEETNDVMIAIEREKQIKGWRREKKLALIRTLNPKFEDLSQDWFDLDSSE